MSLINISGFFTIDNLCLQSSYELYYNSFHFIYLFIDSSSICIGIIVYFFFWHSFKMEISNFTAFRAFIHIGGSFYSRGFVI